MINHYSTLTAPLDANVSTQTTLKSRDIQSSKNTSPRQQVIDWLIKNNLPALPVAPAQDPYQYHKEIQQSSNSFAHCPLDKGKPVPLFTGKNPSYLDEKGKPHLVNHRQYQNKLPSNQDLKKWFAHPDNGIGTLGGHNGVHWIDLDLHQFPDKTQCEQAFWAILERQPALQNTLLEITQSDGYRIGVRVNKNPGFTNFSLTPGGTHVGECLGEGRFTVLSPTIGPSGKPYRNLNLPDKLVEIDEIDFIYSTKKNETQSLSESSPKLNLIPQSTNNIPGSIPLEMLAHNGVQQIINGEDLYNDRSHSLTAAIKELFGWENWCNVNGIAYRGTALELIKYAGGRLGIDAERIERIIKSVENPSQCTSAAYHKGEDSSCWLKISKLDKPTFEAKCPTDIKEQIKTEQKNWARQHNNNGNGNYYPPGNGDSDGGNDDNHNRPKYWKNAPTSWDGEIGYWKEKKKPITDENGAIVGEESVNEFIPKCNFDFQIERELTDSEGGGILIQIKRVFDNKQKSLLIRNLDTLSIKDFNNALVKLYGNGITNNLSTAELNSFIHNKRAYYHYRGGKVYQLAERIGQQENGTYVFSNCQFDKKGNPTSEEVSGIIFNSNLGLEDKIPSPTILPPDKEALPRLVNAMIKFHGKTQILPAMFHLGYVAAGLHYQEIMTCEGRFPILNAYGDAGSIKTVSAENALSMVGWVNGNGTFVRITESACYERLKLTGSLPLLFDDPDKSDWLNDLIQRIYNGRAREVRGNIQVPHSPVIVTSNFLIGDNKPACLSRIIPLYHESSSDGEPSAWDELEQARNKASGCLPQLIALGYQRDKIRSLTHSLRQYLPAAHQRVPDSLGLLTYYTMEVAKLSGFDPQAIYDYTVNQLCKTANQTHSAIDSFTDFMEKLIALRGQSVVGEWDNRIVETREGFKGLAVNMSSVWLAIEKTYKPPYSRKLIETQIAKNGGILNTVQKFPESADEYKAYKRSLLNGHLDSENYVAPIAPPIKPRRCHIIPLQLINNYISCFTDDDLPPGGGDNSPDGGNSPGGGGNSPDNNPQPNLPTDDLSDDSQVTSVTSSYIQLQQKCNSSNPFSESDLPSEESPSYIKEEDHLEIKTEPSTVDVEENYSPDTEQVFSLETHSEIEPITGDTDSSENVTSPLENELNPDPVSDTEVTFREESTVTGCNSTVTEPLEEVIYNSDKQEVTETLLEEEETSDVNNAASPLEFDKICFNINQEMTRIGWSCEDGITYLQQTYGQKSRHCLNDEQLIEFWQALSRLTPVDDDTLIPGDLIKHKVCGFGTVEMVKNGHFLAQWNDSQRPKSERPLDTLYIDKVWRELT